MADRLAHQGEIIAWLDRHFGPAWTLRLPPGSGHETYIAERGDARYFVKVGAAVARAQAMAAAGLGPPGRAAGTLADGVPLLVQPYLAARTPRPADFQAHWAPVATVV